MSTNYLIEAFKELELLDTVDTNKEDKLTGTFEFDKKGAEDLGKFMEDDTFNDFETVIDPEATTEEELQDSYIGMGILGCDICHSMIYKPMEEIVIDEETQMANVGECCPYCYERDGFKIIGKVAPFEEISVEVEKTEDGEEVPEPTVKVNGKDVPVEEAPAKEEEALTAEQKYPVQSPIHEDVNCKVVKSKRKVGAIKESVATESEEKVLDDFTITPEELAKLSSQGKSNMQKLYSVFKDSWTAEEEAKLKDYLKQPILSKDGKVLYSGDKFESYEEKQVEDGHENVDDVKADIRDDHEDELEEACKVEEELSNSEKLFRAFPKLRESIKESINEGMEDISITTDDQVIKVKATPREDKETIVPVEPKEVEAAQPETEEPAESGEEELMDIELDEIDETSFDDLGESYLKKVYDNVNSFKTVNGSLDANNRLVLEGVIEFKSGKKAKTNFIFEAKEVTRKGQLKFVGLNENLSKNKKAFTLAGSTKDGKLICEQLNYNYLAKDEKSGVSKRLYGTIRK